MNAVHLRRVDPARNMHRFYRLDVQPDLCGGVLLMKEWGHIGARGRIVAERYDTEALIAIVSAWHLEYVANCEPISIPITKGNVIYVCPRCPLRSFNTPTMAAFPLQLTLNSVLADEEIMTTPGHSSNLLLANSQVRRGP